MKLSKEYTEYRLLILHKCLNIQGGYMSEEFPEQIMTLLFLDPKAKVLELGGNIGRNSCVIASILDDESNLVTLESHPNIAHILMKNRELNKMTFNIEVSALSKKRLIQRGWDTKPLVEEAGLDSQGSSLTNVAEIPSGYIEVNTMTFEMIQKKYNIVFNTFIIDAEGAFVDILKDMPECLTNIEMIILENDAHTLEKKEFTNNFLAEKGGYQKVYSRKHPSADEEGFYEVFVR